MIAEIPSVACHAVGLAVAVSLCACSMDAERPTDDPSSTDGTPSAGEGGNGGNNGGSGAGAGSSQGGGGDNTDAPCPAGVICVSSFPYTHEGTTVGAASDSFDSYACANEDESGPEVLYRVDIPSDGFLTVNLPVSGMAAGADIDVHLLGSLDANDCLDRGHWQVGELLVAGSYYISADTWVDADGVAAAGAYTLELGLITLDDLQGWGVSSAVAADTLAVLDAAWTNDDVETSAFALVDFSMHAAEKRMWLFDTFAATLAFHTYTTAGQTSDPDADGWADVFSNVPQSHQSSLGLMRASEAYSGDYGKSVRLDGLEVGYNDAVRDRAIVIHPWYGSAPSYVAANPATGTAYSWGCLGIDPDIAEDVRDFLADGGLVLSHFPDGDWSTSSSYLQ
jgi:hypothetical protein